MWESNPRRLLTATLTFATPVRGTTQLHHGYTGYAYAAALSFAMNPQLARHSTTSV